jgi:hypothetical protein
MPMSGGEANNVAASSSLATNRSESNSEADITESRRDKYQGNITTSKTNIYIRGLDENTTDKDLYEMCQK